MVKITNGLRTTVVSRGSYREIYEPMGWKIADSCDESTSAEEIADDEIKMDEAAEKMPEATEESDELEAEENDEVEVPISEMKLDELKRYAAEHGIDISAAKTKQDIKAIIKAEMEG